MKLNVSDFKKIKEDSRTATLKHPSGHEIKIAKSSLSRPMRKQLSEIPMHFDAGGIATDPGDSTQVLTPSSGPVGPGGAVDQSNIDPQDSSLENPGTMPALGANGSQIASAATASQPQNYSVNSNRTPNASTDLLNSVGDSISQGFNQEQLGVQQQAKAQSNLGAAQAAAADQQMQSLKSLNDQYQKQYQSANQSIQSAIQDVNNGHIDPNHYINSKSTMGKVSTAIGLILGGIGGGLLHQENPAAKFLNEQIGRDVEAQRANLDNKKTVLGAYFQQTHNINSAMQMTHAFYTDLYSNMLQKAAAQSADPMAKSRASQLLGQLQIQKAQALRPLAIQRALSSGAGNGIDPNLLPQDMRERSVVVPGVGLRLAPTAQDADKSRDAISSMVSLKNQISQMKQFQGNVGRTVPYSNNDYRGDSARKNLIMELNNLHGLNRLNDNEFDTYKSQVSNPGSWNQGKVGAQLDSLQSLIDQKLNEELSTHLSGFGGIPQTHPINNGGGFGPR